MVHSNRLCCIALFLLASSLMLVPLVGCGSDSASVPEAGTPPPAGATGITAEEAAALKRAEEASMSQ